MRGFILCKYTNILLSPSHTHVNKYIMHFYINTIFYTWYKLLSTKYCYTLLLSVKFQFCTCAHKFVYL